MAYSQEEIDNTFNKICSRISEGESLRSVLRTESMPSSQTFYIWVDSDKDKSKQYARATDERAHSMFEDMLDISDNVEQDIMTLPDGREVVNNAVISRDRLRVDTRKWALSKMMPKKYGDKVEVESTNVNLNTDLDEEERKAAIERVKKGLSEFDDYE